MFCRQPEENDKVVRVKEKESLCDLLMRVGIGLFAYSNYTQNPASSTVVLHELRKLNK